MKNRYLLRLIIWLVLIIGLSVITYINYQIFVVDSVKKDIVLAEKERDELNRELKLIEQKITEYNQKVYEESRYLLFIPDGFDNKEILNYVQQPLLKAEGKLISQITLTEEMPTNIKWSKTANHKDIKAIKVSIVFDISTDKLTTYISELQATVRCIYFGDFRYTIPENYNAKLRVNMSYYLFYKR